MPIQPTARLSEIFQALASEKYWLAQRVVIIVIVAAVVIGLLVVTKSPEQNVYYNIPGSPGQ